MNKEIDKFMDEALEAIKERLGSDYKADWNIYQKNNGISLRGIVISDRTSVISPCIYMDGYYAEYIKTGNMEQIINNVISIYEKNKRQDFPVNLIRDREWMLYNVLFRLINTKKNTELLSVMPHDDLKELGLSRVFYLLFQTSDNQNATITVNNQIMKICGVSKVELLKHAKKNTPLKMKYFIHSIQSVPDEYLGAETEEQIETDWEHMPHLYVLTNLNALYGASCLMYDRLLKKVADGLKSGFYVLPSSVHEVLLYPSDNTEETEMLKDMVTEINRTELAEEEILTDTVYYYNRKTGKLSAA